TAGGDTEVFVAEERERLIRRLRERITCLLAVAAVVIEAAAMEFVGARLGLNRDNAGRGFSEFGIVVLERDLGFLNRVEVRIDDNDSKDRVLVVGAVQLEGRAAKVLAINENLLRSLRILGRSVAPADELLCAGRKKLEVGEVAIQNRKVFDVL